MEILPHAKEVKSRSRLTPLLERTSLINQILPKLSASTDRYSKISIIKFKSKQTYRNMNQKPIDSLQIRDKDVIYPPRCNSQKRDSIFSREPKTFSREKVSFTKNTLLKQRKRTFKVSRKYDKINEVEQPLYRKDQISQMTLKSESSHTSSWNKIEPKQQDFDLAEEIEKEDLKSSSSAETVAIKDKVVSFNRNKLNEFFESKKQNLKKEDKNKKAKFSNFLP